MKKFLIIIFLIIGCSSNNNELKTNLPEINFTDNLTIDEFQRRLTEYAQTSPFPNINE